jgi:hypothetical protein
MKLMEKNKMKAMSQIKYKEDGLRKSTENSFKVSNKIYSYLLLYLYLSIAIKIYGKDWKKVEDFIGTRSGA